MNKPVPESTPSPHLDAFAESMAKRVHRDQLEDAYFTDNPLTEDQVRQIIRANTGACPRKLSFLDCLVWIVVVVICVLVACAIFYTLGEYTDIFAAGS